MSDVLCFKHWFTTLHPIKIYITWFLIFNQGWNGYFHIDYLVQNDSFKVFALSDKQPTQFLIE